MSIVSKVRWQLSAFLSFPKLFFYGDYASWKEAEDDACKYGEGYEGRQILEKVAKSTEMVRAGKAAYERDGVCFYRQEYKMELLAALFFILFNEGYLKVLDFGGALGSSFFQNRLLFQRMGAKVEWNIVEQSQFVKYGKEYIPEIRFYKSISECFTETKGNVNCIIFSSVLQYLEYPYDVLRQALDTEVKYIIVDREPILPNGSGERVVLEKVPTEIYDAIYPAHLLEEQHLFSTIENGGYERVFNWKEKDKVLYKIKYKFKQVDLEGFLYKKQ